MKILKLKNIVFKSENSMDIFNNIVKNDRRENTDLENTQNKAPTLLPHPPPTHTHNAKHKRV